MNWMEFREVVPAKVQTVLLPTGTVEAHGVANNGADVTVPRARAMACVSTRSSPGEAAGSFAPPPVLE